MEPDKKPLEVHRATSSDFYRETALGQYWRLTYPINEMWGGVMLVYGDKIPSDADKSITIPVALLPDLIAFLQEASAALEQERKRREEFIG
jgi:hypothetical protein